MTERTGKRSYDGTWMDQREYPLAIVAPVFVVAAGVTMVMEISRMIKDKGVIEASLQRLGEAVGTLDQVFLMPDESGEFAQDREWQEAVNAQSVASRRTYSADIIQRILNEPVTHLQ